MATTGQNVATNQPARVAAAPNGPSGAPVNPAVLQTVRRYWGFEQLRPLQAEAIEAALAGRDSLVVMPTGGGKSLCYQVPPAIGDGTDVVISPLISLMKDQVDGLRECGYPAAALYSGIDGAQRREIEQSLHAGQCRLLFVAPERAVTPWFSEMAKRLQVRRFAIDEAHCISHWGHDFRREYRELAKLRDQFPEASLQAFTATATPRVRSDIVQQLGLRNPAVLVGSFDRPNLIYRVLPSVDIYAQTIEVIRRHANEAVIVYCITRKDTETMAGVLNANGIQAAAYHAGIDSAERHKVQDAFAAEKLNVVVATVAFGMGIDRSNVRCVLHTAMPKTVEHYQQESGRAGRDGLAAECVLLYSYSDAMRWEGLIRKSAENAENPAAVIEAQLQLLKQIARLCNAPTCRHRALVEYFGQEYERENCGACDVCLADVEGMEDGTVAAQKILSCVGRVNEGFGVGHVVDVLTGADTETIRRLKHNELSTYGLLKEMAKKQVQSMVYQLLDQSLLERTPGDRPVLKLNPASWQVLRGQRDVKLVRPKQKAPAQAKVDADSWEGVDRPLFEHLRSWRQTLAAERHIPPYLILDDSALRSLARLRPTQIETLRQVRGIGEKRQADFGESLIELVTTFCQQNKLATDQSPNKKSPSPLAGEGRGEGEAANSSSRHEGATNSPSPLAGEGRGEGYSDELPTYIKPKSKSAIKQEAFELFRKQWSIDDVKHKLDRARSTVAGYLAEFIAEEKPANINCWVSKDTYKKIVEAASTVGERKLSPIFERLDGKISYDEIRLVLAHVEGLANS